VAKVTGQKPIVSRIEVAKSRFRAEKVSEDLALCQNRPRDGENARDETDYEYREQR
jgi:hypothetical protein